jgi:beta-lactam-binding protein with PASTA domain
MRRLLFTAAVAAALAASAIAYAAAGRQLSSVPSTPAATEREVPAVLVVPDVRREAFVFAKEQLQDEGFAWKVTGGVEGYAANTVMTQSPAPGTKLVDTGAPLITLTLSRNKPYKQSGDPQNTSPYAPTALKLAGSN